MSDTSVIDPADIEQFAGRIVSIYTGSMLNYMIDIGHRTGLFTAAAAGPATSDELAARAGLTERYVREWLGAMVTGGVIDYDPATTTYTLPAAHAAVLTDGPMSLAPMAALGTHLGKHVHQVARAFREGGGVPYEEFRPEFTDVIDGISRVFYDAQLVDAWVPLAPGLSEKLRAGMRVADVACGAGHALIILAREFPESTFVGYDLDDVALARGRAEASGAQLDNVRFEHCDVARLAVDEVFDAVFVFDALHDQVDPDAVLGRIREALVPGGMFVMKEPHFADALEDNLGNPMAPLMYGVSTLHCMTVSLAHGGAGIGTVFGEQLALGMLVGCRLRRRRGPPGTRRSGRRDLRQPHGLLSGRTRSTVRDRRDASLAARLPAEAAAGDEHRGHSPDRKDREVTPRKGMCTWPWVVGSEGRADEVADREPSGDRARVRSPIASGNHNPDRYSSTKKTMLRIGPAASWFGITLLAAIPRAENVMTPTQNGERERAHLFWQRDAVTDATDQQQYDDLQHGHDERVDDQRSDVDPRRQWAQPQSLQQAELATIDERDGEDVEASRHHAVRDEPGHVVLDETDVAEKRNVVGVPAQPEQKEEHDREPDRERSRERVAPERALLEPDLRTDQAQVGRRRPLLGDGAHWIASPSSRVSSMYTSSSVMRCTLSPASSWPFSSAHPVRRCSSRNSSVVSTDTRPAWSTTASGTGTSATADAGRQRELDVHRRPVPAAERRRRALRHDLAPRDDGDTRRERLGLFHVVRGQDDRCALLLQRAHQLPSAATGRRIEPRCGLVEEDQVGSADDAEPEIETALLAAGQRLDASICFLVEAHHSDDIAEIERRRVEAGLALQHLAHGEERLDRELLQHDAESLAQRAAGRRLGWVASEDFDPAPVAHAETFEDLDRRRLSRTVRPEQGEDLARARLRSSLLARPPASP